MRQEIPDLWINKDVRFPVRGQNYRAQGILKDKNAEGITIRYRVAISGPRVSYDGGRTWSNEGGTHFGPWQTGEYVWDDIGEVELSPDE